MIKIDSLLTSRRAGVAVLMLSVQGLLPASLALIASIVSPAIFGNIRWAESILSLVLLVATFGVPSVIFREAANTDSRKRHIQLLVFSGVLVTSISAILIAALLFFDSSSVTLADAESWSTLYWLLPTIALASLSRCLVAFIQGRQVANQFTYWIIGYGILSVATLAGFSIFAGLRGWVTGRYVTEILCFIALCCVCLTSIGKENSDTAERFSLSDILTISKDSIAASWALFIRAVADNGAILMLGLVPGAAAQIAVLGVVSLWLLPPMLAFSIIVHSAMPRLVAARHDTAQYATLVREVGADLRKVALPAAALVAIAGYIIAFVAPSQKYPDLGIILLISVPTLLIRCRVLISGVEAVVHGWYFRSSIIAIFEIIVFAAAWRILELSNAQGAAVWILISVLISLAPSYWLSYIARLSTEPKQHSHKPN